MKKRMNNYWLVLWVFFICLICFTCSAVSQEVVFNGKSHVFKNKEWYRISQDSILWKINTHRIIVKCKERGQLTNDQLRTSVLLNVSILKKVLDNYYILIIEPLFESHACFSIAEKLLKSGQFEYIGFSSYGIEHATPNDTHYNSQTNLHSNILNMPAAWDIEKGDNSIILAFIDSGIDMDHDDLKDNLWTNSQEINGVDSVDDDGNGYTDDKYRRDTFNNDNNPNDTGGHGTLSAGIACARPNNSIGVAGIAGGWNTTPGVKLMVLRSGEGDHDEADVAEALDYARQKGADVINMSLGIDNVPILQQAVANAINAGCIIVASAGNSGISPVEFPARYPGVIGVGATLEENDSRWGDSNYGDSLDVMAPGGTNWIRSTYLNNSYWWHGGTSASAPHVAGLAALMLSLYPDLSRIQITDRIKWTAKDLGTPGGINIMAMAE